MKLVIFDLDDTLIDFATTRQMAYVHMGELLDREGIDSAGFLAACVQVDRPLFLQFERGLLTREQYRLRRFSDPFGLIGLEPPAELVRRLNKLFMDVVNDTPVLYPDVRPVLQTLREQGIVTAILTNGPSDGQRRKLKATALHEWVEYVAIGEETGFSKPLEQAFHGVVDRFSLARAHATMVGDHPELDYDGALRAGLDALLLDRDARHAQRGCTSIRSLHEILQR
ncbi:MAG TPA: HAD family hydrolase [Burkholderiaceae bacterium]|nr:HAD family hydrolase [Burkholderiaceae bacterium]